ncbi:pentatricopeptide repeat-containing protein At4g32450, mitochondrial-like [Silene latifolia]|uniref:pentatricopeptide repeat-containing protein At4g32450, mitochondrial-like n=1 Tax=Silene latifolia TaxID=37657 RepID=UPI003D778136
MKQYQSPLFLARLLRYRYSHRHISHQNVISLCQGGTGVDVALMPKFVYAGHYLGSRQYSNGFHALNRVPTSYDDVRSNGRVGNSDVRSGAEYRKNVNHIQQWSSTENPNPVNEGTNSEYLRHDYAEKAIQQNPVYPGSRNAMGSQQVTGHWSINPGPYQQYPSNPLTVNAVGHESHGYQQENTRVQPSLGQNAEDVNDPLKELDCFCQEWDLVNAVACMKDLSLRGVGIDLPRYFTLIEACGEAKALVEGKAVHEHILNYVSPISTSIFNRILNMYGKCGSMDDAYDTFNKMPERNLTSWDNMISWYAKNGLGEEAIDTFTEFKESGLKPDGQMFLGLFDACGVVGDVGEGMLHFDSMTKIYGITPTMEHYASIVHMFGSACDLDGALEFIEKMPVEPNVDVWESLMNISRIQGNVELGERCAQIVEELDPSRLTIESKTGRLPIKDSILKRKVKKTSLSEHRQHEYRAGDRSHPEHEKIYALLRGFKESLKEAGYVPETRFVLHDITQEEKEEAIMAHSERLASAYALLTSSPRAQMTVMKNLRVCGDCHNLFKILSKLVGRKIVMRDQKRFHHFEGGTCSCNDYW